MRRTYRASRVAGWNGWCSPCQRDDRPLVLTRGGPAGLLAWLAGLGDDDRCLLLTCRVCGDWQVVPAREEDDPEVVLAPDVEVLEAVAAIVHDARAVPAAPVVELPAPVPAAAVLSDAEAGLELAGRLDDEVVVTPEPAAAAPDDAPPVPRRAVARIVTVPDAEPLPAVSPEAVAAAARLLAAARTPLAPTTARRTPLDRSRRSRTGPTPRRADRLHAVPAGLPVELPAVLGLPAGSRQVVLAAAS